MTRTAAQLAHDRAYQAARARTPGTYAYDALNGIGRPGKAKRETKQRYEDSEKGRASRWNYTCWRRPRLRLARRIGEKEIQIAELERMLANVS